jgi:hypothetical protein
MAIEKRLLVVFFAFISVFLSFNVVSALAFSELVDNIWVNAALVFVLLFNIILLAVRNLFKKSYGAAIIISMIIAILGTMGLVTTFQNFFSNISLWLLILAVVAIALLLLRFTKGKGIAVFIILGLIALAWLAFFHNMACPSRGTLPENVCQVIDVLSMIILIVLFFSLLFWMFRKFGGNNGGKKFFGGSGGGGSGSKGDGNPKPKKEKPEKGERPGKGEKGDKPDKQEEMITIRLVVKGNGTMTHSAIPYQVYPRGIHSIQIPRRTTFFTAHPVNNNFEYWLFDSVFGLRKLKGNLRIKVPLRNILYKRREIIRVAAVFKTTEQIQQQKQEEKKDQERQEEKQEERKEEQQERREERKVPHVTWSGKEQSLLNKLKKDYMVRRREKEALQRMMPVLIRAENKTRRREQIHGHEENIIRMYRSSSNLKSRLRNLDSEMNEITNRISKLNYQAKQASRK